jgi:EAL domain-containing protein (putative c-di-GMP-specific phosphodiesterase class I)
VSQDLNRELFQGQEIVFSWGDPGDSAYVIEEGCVEVLAGQGSQQKRIALLTEGAMFGEVALLDRQARTASVRTLVPTRLIRIDRSHVEELLSRSDPVIQYLLGLLLARFRTSHDLHAGLASAVAHGEPHAFQQPSSEDLHLAAVRTLSLAQDLSNAVETDQFELFYQPLLALDGLVMTGYEALIRWRHPALGLINPAEFIPLAEKTGLIHKIGQWVLHRAIADWAELRPFCRDDSKHHPYVSVNLSAPELASPGIVDSIRDRLAQYNMDPSELRIELTETVIIQNMAAVSESVQQLRNLGTGVALDDFGTGYAGLDYLQTLPFTCLKIDRAFVQQIHQSDRSVHIIRAALELARSMGLSTIAEGIEDAATGERLASMGCSHAQGYYYARPMAKAQIAAWATAQQA